jgi:hypothetical protein
VSEEIDRFDAAYYRRFYENKSTRAHSAEEVACLAQGLDGFATWLLKRELKSVLEVGAGPGFLRDWFQRERKKIRYVSTDFSAHACKQYGHTQLDVGAKRLKQTFDLVICQGVLQYLPDDACIKAIKHLASMTNALLYLEILTAKDVRSVCDLDGTDTSVYLRDGSFYREHLAKHVHQIGAGLWAKQGSVPLYELEAP